MYRSKQAAGQANRKTRRRARPPVPSSQPLIGELMQHAATTLADLLGDTCLTWQLSDPEHMSVSGTLAGTAIVAKMRRIDETKFVLLNRGFHWVSELPFNK